MRLIGAVTQGSGAVNEDGFGFLGEPREVSAAWVFDGVTGINARNHLGEGTDARWLVARAHAHLLELAAKEISLEEILARLVDGLIADFAAATEGLDLPRDYDPPAACLVLVKRYGTEWKALRLGDSCLLARDDNQSHRVLAASPNNAFDHWLTREALKRRADGVLDVKALLAEFAPRLREARARRNRPDCYSVLECSHDALAMAEMTDLGTPAEILLCTDGYYRAVDHYGLHDEAGLMDASARSVEDVLAAIRAAEAAVVACRRHSRIKQAGDAMAAIPQR